MKRITMLSLLISITPQINSRWVAFKNSTGKDINVKLSTSTGGKLKRKPNHLSLMIEPGETEIVAVFTKKRGGKGKYLTGLKIQWPDGTTPWQTKGLDLDRINRYITALTDNASKENPQSNAIKVSYDVERMMDHTTGSWVKNPKLDYFEIKIPSGTHDPFKAQRFKEKSTKAGDWFKKNVLRIPVKRGP